MKKYKVILLVLIIGFTGFFVYDNFFRPYKWEKAEENINKYMVKQGISKGDISKITKEKSKKATYNGILYTVSYKGDPQYEYQYFYSDDYYALYINHVLLQIYDLSEGNKCLEGEGLKNVKYPPIGLDK